MAYMRMLRAVKVARDDARSMAREGFMKLRMVSLIVDVLRIDCTGVWGRVSFDSVGEGDSRNQMIDGP